MIKVKQLLSLTCLCCFFAAPVQAKKLTLIYVPLDNRPVCTNYVNNTLEATDCKIILPPEKYIATQDRIGNPEAVWEWLQTKAPKADAAVISTDSLIYGGLVASRTHSFDQDLLDQRTKRLENLNQALPIKMYVFSTIMRTPRASQGRVEPAYYSEIGPAIFSYSELLDKADQNKLNTFDKITKTALERNLPKASLKDWLSRREKNLKVNESLTQISRKNKFHYLAIGKDDNAPLSHTHMEARKLSLKTFDMNSNDFQIIDGVDQLGLLLLTRAYNEANNLKPTIYPVYSPGPGQATLPQYSDARLQDSVPQQIIAAGGKLVKTPEQADLILAINTPENGIVQDSTGTDNQFFPNQSNKQFIATIKSYLDQGAKLSLADISYSNGADNGFMHTLANNIDLGSLQSYNAWNTADNAIGFAISQGLLAEFMAKNQKDLLLKQRLLDDWFYQSNARKTVSNFLDKSNKGNQKYDLGSSEGQLLNSVTKECKLLANKYAFTRGMTFKLSFPWKRLFEVNAEIISTNK